MTIRLLAVMALLLATRAASAQPAPRLLHVPVGQAEAGQPLVVAAEVEHAFRSELALRYRPIGAPEWRDARFARASDSTYRAQIPAADVAPPGFEYFIVAARGNREHFASAASPHRVLVFEDEDAALRAREMERRGGRRYQVHVAAEMVDFGTRTITDARDDRDHEVRDSYYRIDADFSYRLMRFPLRALRFGYTRLVGTTPETERGDGLCAERPEDPCTRDAGFRAGGWVELRFRITELVSADLRSLIQATPSGAGFGGRGELRFGDDMATHFALGGEAISEVGANFFFRLGWATVPRFPMAATVELSDYPSAHRDAGVRLLYDVAYDLGDGLRVGGRLGYQARDQGIGGATAGLSATLDL